VVSRDSEENSPEPEVPPIAESLVQQTEEEQMLREAIAVLTPQCRRLVEMLFFESPSRPYAEVAAELGLALGSIGFTRQKCMERLRRQLEELGFTDDACSAHKKTSGSLIAGMGQLSTDIARRNFLARHPKLISQSTIEQLAQLVVQRVRVSTKEALHLAEAAMLIAKRLRRKEAQPLALRANGQRPLFHR